MKKQINNKNVNHSALTTKGQDRLIVGILLALLVIFLVFSLVAKVLIKKKYILSYCIITNAKVTGRDRATELEYDYFINGNSYHSNTSFNNSFLSSKNSNHFIGRAFPIVYYPYCHTINRTLIFPQNFDEFKIPFPDSLKWVQQYVKE